MRRRLLFLWLKVQLDKTRPEPCWTNLQVTFAKTAEKKRIQKLSVLTSQHHHFTSHVGRCNISECMCDAAVGWLLTSGQQAASWTSSPLNFLPSTCCCSWFAFHISHLKLLTTRFSSQCALLNNFWWKSLSPCRHR